MIIKNNKTTSALYKGTKEIEKRYKGTLVVYEAWKELTKSGVPPITLQKCKNAILVDYKIYGDSVQKITSVLPEEYEQLAYIEATGTQYLEINYVASNITTTKGSFQLTSIKEATMLFGSRINSNSGGLNYALNWGGGEPYKYYNSFNRSASSCLTEKEIDLDKHTFEKAKNKLYMDDELLHTVTMTTFTTPYNMIVFGCNTNGKIGYLTKAKIFNLQFYDEDVLMVDLIPCYRKSDNEIGMYDLVTGTFYTNKGTGVFLKGNIEPTPDAPIEVESVGDMTKNLLDVYTCYSDFANENGGITLHTGELYDFYAKQKKVEGVFKENTQYTFSCDYKVEEATTIITPQIWYTDGTKTYINIGNTGYTSEGTITMVSTKGKTVSHFNFTYGSNVNRIYEVELTNMQLEEGATATKYEPYGYKIPVMVNSENLLDLSQLPSTSVYRYGDYGIKQIKTQYTNGGFKFPVNIPAGSQLYISYKYVESFGNASDSKAVYLRAHSSSGNRKNIFLRSNHIDGKFYVYACDVLTEDIVQLEFYTMNTWEVGSYYIIDNVKITYEKPITTNIYLNEPLRKIGDYADYIDFKNQKVIRNVGNQIFDGTEEWVLHTTTDEGNVFRNENLLTPLIGASVFDTFMSHFAVTDIYTTATFTNGLYRFTSNSDVVNISGSRLYVSAEQTTVEEFKTWLAENKPTIMYPLAEPDDKETIELPNILLNKGTNIIDVFTNILPSNMEVTYMGKKIK